MTSAVTSASNLVQYSFTPNARTPWVPNDECLIKIIEGECSYRPPYPKDTPFTLQCGPIVKIGSQNQIIYFSNTVLHAIEAVEIIAKHLTIGKGTVIVAHEITLDAETITILDDETSPIQTTLIAQKVLGMNTNKLTVKQADIVFQQLKPESVVFETHITRRGLTQGTLELAQAIQSLEAPQNTSQNPVAESEEPSPEETDVLIHDLEDRFKKTSGDS